MCKFCENIGIGLPNWDFLPDDDFESAPNGIAIEIRKIFRYSALVFTNSADEYGAGVLYIEFCPICGKFIGENSVSRNLIQEHKEVCDKLNEIYEQKNRAYGNSFGDTYNDLGIISAVTRISDKFNRLKNLAKDNSIPQGDESIADTLLDMANYCIMTYMELKSDDV